MKWNREEYIELMTFGRVQRQMFVELFGPLVRLDEEWKSQGATQDQINLTAFDFDYVPTFGCGGKTGFLHPHKQVILEDTPSYTISIDGFGRKVKLSKGYASIPLPMEYPVKTMDDWLKIKHQLEFDPSRIDWNAVEHAKKLQNEGVLIVGSIPGGFDMPRELMGEEGACISYYEDEELMADIVNTMSDMSFRVLDAVSDRVKIDNLIVHEDLAGKSGPLVGPNQINDFIKPYYRRIWDMLSAKGTKLFSQDSDGDMRPVVDAFLDCGVNVMYPAEPASGMDMVELRKKYGNRLAFKGGIDKFVLQKSKQDILKELEYKLQPIMQAGGTVFGLDHRIPNGTPLENYIFYVNTAREMLGLPPINEKSKGWMRQAF